MKITGIPNNKLFISYSKICIRVNKIFVLEMGVYI